MKRWIPSLNVLAIASLGVCQGIAQTVPSAPAATGNDYTFDVSTTQPWTDTGIDLQTGDVLEISASGAKICDPQGVSGASAQGLPVSSALPGALIAKLQAQAVPVLVGSSQEVKVDAPGHLFLGINTGEKPPCKGSFAVKVHRQEQAESNRGTVLKQQLASAAETFLAGQFGVQPGGSANAAVTPALKISDAPLDAGLRKDIDGLPRRVNDQFKNLGDMVNFVLIGSEKQVQSALDAANWHVADTDDKKAVVEAAMMTYESKDYLAMPMSTLYLFNRPQDFGYEQAEPIAMVASRHHFRLWKAPFTWNGQTVWVGAGTHDIGFAKDKRNGNVTHKIDPNVDGEKENIGSSLQKGSKVKSMSYYLPLNPVQQAKNATGDGYTSDGRILVVFLQ
ncbi:MAG TPA: LssY C-terminal domain-containing protein [Terriglobales bacterium]|nr:LssY C-terminal domain-containing protein [Terriglobales bacterium]